MGGAALHERVAALAPTLPASERTVAEFMAQNPDAVALSSAAEMGDATGTSDATVVRTAKALGYSGLQELKRGVIETLTRRRNPAHVLDDRLGRVVNEDDDGLDQVLLFTEDVIRQLRDGIERQEWARAVSSVLAARRVFAYGIGPAGLTAEYLALSLNRIGIEATALSATGFRLADGLLTMSEGDLTFIFAPLRLFREIETVIEHARASGARIVVVTEALGLVLSGKVDVILSTPQTTTGAASENTAAFILAHALALAVASRTHDSSVQTMELLNRLRARVAGAQLDT